MLFVPKQKPQDVITCSFLKAWPTERSSGLLVFILQFFGWFRTNHIEITLILIFDMRWFALCRILKIIISHVVIANWSFSSTCYDITSMCKYMDQLQIADWEKWNKRRKSEWTNTFGFTSCRYHTSWNSWIQVSKKARFLDFKRFSNFSAWIFICN